MADEADGTYAAVIKNQRDSKCARDRKESGDHHNHTKGPNKSNTSGRDGYRHTEMTINMIRAGTAMTTTRTISLKGIKTTIAKAAAMLANIVTLTSMTKE
eukprot:5135266-Ditylum_brightwellii.AAC.1